jgi:hypothetical protein
MQILAIMAPSTNSHRQEFRGGGIRLDQDHRKLRDLFESPDGEMGKAKSMVFMDGGTFVRVLRHFHL